jgi:hypothetical protein
MGVHEHWNNDVDKQYTRDLGIGDGIELLRYLITDIGENSPEQIEIVCYPNPFTNKLTFEYALYSPSVVHLQIYGMDGRLVKTISERQSIGANQIGLDASDLVPGFYVYNISADGIESRGKILKSDI